MGIIGPRAPRRDQFYISFGNLLTLLPVDTCNGNGVFMSSLLRDLRHGARQMIRKPGFSAAAIASLALGIGLNTTLFSVVNGVLLRDSPVSQPDRLVEIYTGLTNDFPQLTTSYLDYVDIRNGASALKGIAASVYVRGILSSGERPALVTSSLPPAARSARSSPGGRAAPLPG
jgi:hypothetical protein